MIRVHPSPYFPGFIAIDPIHYLLTPQEARALAARIVKVAERVERKKKGKTK